MSGRKTHGGARGEGAARSHDKEGASAGSSGTRYGGPQGRYAVIVLLVVASFFAAYSYALGSSERAVSPGSATAAYDPATGAALPVAATDPSASGAAGVGCACCDAGGPQQEIRKAATMEGGEQVIAMTVNGGYDPNVIEARAGVPLRIRIEHPSPGGCDQTLVFRDFGVYRDLPPYGRTEVVFTPKKAGTYGFTCGMNMLSGTLVVK